MRQRMQAVKPEQECAFQQECFTTENAPVREAVFEVNVTFPIAFISMFRARANQLCFTLSRNSHSVSLVHAVRLNLKHLYFQQLANTVENRYMMVIQLYLPCVSFYRMSISNVLGLVVI